MTRMPSARGDRGRRRLLPGALADAAAFRRDRLGALADWARAGGDVARRRVGPYHLVLVSDPDLVADLLTGRAPLGKGPVLRAAKVILGEGLLTSEGDLHRRRRRLVAPALAPRVVAAHDRAVTDAAAGVAGGWRDGGVVDVHAAMQRLALTVAGRALFSADIGGEAREVGSAIADLLALSHSPAVPLAPVLARLPWGPGARLRNARGRLDAIVDRLIAERRDGQGHDDVLTRLVDAGIDAAGIRDEVMTLLLAGHETTASALSWAWWLLAHDRPARERVHREVDEVLGHRTPTAADVDRLPWVRGVVAESLRLYPPSWAMGRRATAPIAIGDHVAPAGALVVMSQWVIHRDARWWPEPDRFDPGRWEDGHRPRRLTYFPFGGGPRSCVGEGFAWLEATLALAAISRSWELLPIPGADWRPLPRMTLRPAAGALLRSRRRAVAEGGRGAGHAGAES